MKRSFVTEAEAFPEFSKELSADAIVSYWEKDGATFLYHLPWRAPKAWLHVLYPPLPAAEIFKIEWDLQVVLPSDYKHFLALWNGATLFFCDLEIWGKVESTKPRGFRPAFDLVKENRLLREHVPDFRHLIGIANYSYGDIICLDLSSGTTQNAIVCVWDNEEREVTTERWSSLRQWLAYEMQRGKEVWAEELAKRGLAS
jgi:hypothetical protein